jgi:tetratricopeptide (TPR) repeat protein
MASVFLSYDRRDTKRAKPIASALEKAGHTVWWDLHVRGGAQFAKVIEEALRQAQAVVVLWSANSVESAWVRDEAAAGRDSGRLVPATLDGTEPPLGFRQYQTIDLAKSGGRRIGEGVLTLLHAIDGITGSPKASRPDKENQNGTKAYPRRTLFAGLVGTAVVALGIYAATRLSDAGSSIPTITVEPAEKSSQSLALARDLLVKLGRLQAADPKALKILGEQDGADADFTFEVSALPSRDKAAATIAMLARDGTLLFSRDFERPADQYGDLKQQLSLTAGRVLSCATEGLTDNDATLDQRTLKLYLNGCSNLSDLAWQDFRALVPVFREVTKRAPRFDGGWAKLVGTEAFVLGWETVPRNSPEGRALRQDIIKARQLNPRMPEAYWAEYMLVGEYDLIRAAAVLDRAVRDNPDNIEVLGMQVPLLRRVGRLKEALDAAKRGAGDDPLDPGAVSGYIEVLTYAGKLEAALLEIEEAERIWPGTRPLIEARFRFHLRYGDPKEAQRIVRSGVNPDYARFESFLEARIDPTKANVDRAVADARAEIGRNPRAVGWLVQALAQFGREDQIYPIIEGPAGKSALYLSDALFRPQFRKFRQDPRFMRSAKNIGLVDYWQTTQKWPDFCFEPDLPYDCRQEAARLVN